ncbi:MAG: hypothetical protein ACE5FT_06980 [Candidatus Nanoarchaeia archaeon]
MVEIFVIAFFASIAAFAYLAYKLHQKEKWRQIRERWAWIAWAIVGVLNFADGFIYGNTVMTVIGAVMALTSMSAFLTFYIESELRVKKVLETTFGAVALGVIIYGYFITGSFILEIITLFILAMFFVAFLVSYLLPRIRGKSSESGGVT